MHGTSNRPTAQFNALLLGKRQKAGSAPQRPLDALRSKNVASIAERERRRPFFASHSTALDTDVQYLYKCQSTSGSQFVMAAAVRTPAGLPWNSSPSSVRPIRRPTCNARLSVCRWRQKLHCTESFIHTRACSLGLFLQVPVFSLFFLLSLSFSSLLLLPHCLAKDDVRI